jgi:hypothetical protein
VTIANACCASRCALGAVSSSAAEEETITKKTKKISRNLNVAHITQASIRRILMRPTKGLRLTALPRDGIKILYEAGRYIEAGDWNGLAKAAIQNPRIANDIDSMTTWLPGSKVPNYTLSAPTNPPLRIFQNSTSVESKTCLDQLLQPNMGCIQWAACTKF